MPHVILEYSSTIEAAVRQHDITSAVHDVMRDCGLFTVAAIKTRSYASDDFHVGENGQQGSFLHILVYLMEGRTIEQKQTLARGLFAAIDPLVPPKASLTVDIRELDKQFYQKRASH